MLTNTYTKARREAARISERAARGELAYDFTADGETVIDPESLYASTAVLFMDLTEETSRNALVDSAEDQFFAACDDAEAEFEAELEGTTHKSGLSSLDYTVLAIFEPAYDTSTLPGWHAWELEMIKRAHQLASRSQTSRRGAIGTIGTVVATTPAAIMGRKPRRNNKPVSAGRSGRSGRKPVVTETGDRVAYVKALQAGHQLTKLEGTTLSGSARTERRDRQGRLTASGSWTW